MIRALFLLLLTTFSAPSVAGADPATQDPLALVAQHLGGSATVRTPFRQTKTVSALSKPLVSSGTMTFAKHQGLIWKTVEPYPSETVVTPRGIVRRDAAGTRVVMRASEHRAAEHFAKTFLSLFSGDLDAVREGFELSAEAHAADRWTLRLVPRRDALRRVITEIALAGAPRPAQFTLSEANGDRTVITFAATGIDESPLTADEAQVFDEIRGALER